MIMTKYMQDLNEMVRNQYKFGNVPIEARVIVLEELVELLCNQIDKLNQRNDNDGK